MIARLTAPFKFLWMNRDTLILSIVLALAVWVSAVIASDPNREDTFPQRIPLKVIGLDEKLMILETLPANVELVIRAPESVWSELENNPEMIVVQIDLSGMGPGQHTLKIEPQLNITPARVVGTTPSSVTFNLEVGVTKNLPIDPNLTGELALGYQIDKITINPDEVQVSGPDSLVSQVTSVSADLQIANARSDTRAVVNLKPLDKDGRVLSGLTLTPAQVEMVAHIVQAGGYRDVAVKVETTGQPASGYRVTNISVSPPTVTLFSSDPQVTASMPGYVSTVPLDLTETSDDIETRLGLILPDGVTMVGSEQSVQVQIGIAAIETSISLTVPIQVNGLGTGLHADLSPDNAEIILTGPLRVLEALTPEDIIIFVDLTGLETGSYLVEPQADILLEKVVLESINPDTIEVIITVSTNGSATPTIAQKREIR